MKDHQISYVWMNIGVCSLLLVSFIFFALNTNEQRGTIWKYHDTISSFCAKENSWENKFLLFFSVLISLNLSFLHFEEYNSRDEVTKMEQILFVIEILVISFFMLVGVLYVPGRNPKTANRDYDLGTRWCRCSIEVSSWLHSIFAVFFMLFLTVINAIYAVERCHQRPGSPWTIITSGWSLFSILVGAAFITVQGVLYCHSHLTLEEHEDESDLKDENDGPEPEQEKKKLPSIDKSKCALETFATTRNLQFVRMASFVLEIMWVTSIVLQDGVCSVYRNKLFPYFGATMDDYVASMFH